MQFYGLVLGGLAVWRVAHLVVAEDGPWSVVARLRRAAGHGFWGSLMDCFECTSLWVAVAPALALGASRAERALLWPALSAGAILLERVTAKPPVPAYFEDGDLKENADELRRTEESGERPELGARVRLSPGELVDRVLILELKLAHVADAEARHRLRLELEDYERAYRAHYAPRVDASTAMTGWVAALREVNAALWRSEDELRRHERAGEFGAPFIEVARSVYKTNDERARLKRCLNEALGSMLADEKIFDVDPSP